MSKPVELADVLAAIDRFGPLATLVTVGSDSTPHVGTTLVSIGDGRLEARIGARTRENVATNRSVTLSWVDPAQDYQLIIDGTASVNGTADPDGTCALAIAVNQGILHRLAGRPDAGPSCRRLPLSDDEAGEATCTAPA